MKYVLPCFLLSLSLLSSSCFDDPVAAASGDMWGYVRITDIDKLEVSDRSGVTVQLEGTSYSTTTDANGKWLLEDVAPGVYTVNYTSSGYSEIKQLNTQFVGNGDLFLGYTDMYEIPSFTITDLAVNYNPDTEHYEFVGHISENIPVEKFRWATIVYSTDPNSDFKATLQSIVGGLTIDTKTAGTKITGYVTQAILAGSGVAPTTGIPSGTTIYFKAYPLGSGYTTYFDVVEQVDVVTSASSQGSQVVSAIMQ